MKEYQVNRTQVCRVFLTVKIYQSSASFGNGSCTSRIDMQLFSKNYELIAVSAFFEIAALLIPHGTSGQSQKFDSLKQLLPGNSNLEHIDILHKMAIECYDINNDLGFHYLKIAVPLANQSGDSLRIVRSKRIKGQLLRRFGKLVLAP